VTLHAVLSSLSERGHEVRVMVDDGDDVGPLDGVEVFVGRDRAEDLRNCGWSDIVIGQLGARWKAMAVAARSRRPLVYFMHIGNVARNALYGNPDLTVFSSEVLRRQYPWIKQGLVVHPPIVETNYAVTPGDSITLVNLIEAKGSSLFFALAACFTDRPFLGVRGRESQSIPAPVPSNVVIVDQAADMRDVFARTRILLVPSVYESYGRVGLEACVSGIPVVAHPADGLQEALGDGACWADRNNLNEWAEQIRALDDPAVYAEQSRKARAWFESLDPSDEIDALERAMLQLRVATTR
jgi:hypothetical protein